VAATNDHLPSTCGEHFNGFAFGAIGCGLGVCLPLEGPDFSSLLRSELELKLQPVGVTETANNERPLERVEAVFADLVDSGSAINVDGNDAAIFWTSAKANSLHTGVVAQISEGKALRRGPGLDQGVFVCAARQQTTALVNERLEALELRFGSLHSEQLLTGIDGPALQFRIDLFSEGKRLFSDLREATDQVFENRLPLRADS